MLLNESGPSLTVSAFRTRLALRGPGPWPLCIPAAEGREVEVPYCGALRRFSRVYDPGGSKILDLST